jgi:hypothetical protein
MKFAGGVNQMLNKSLRALCLDWCFVDYVEAGKKEATTQPKKRQHLK